MCRGVTVPPDPLSQGLRVKPPVRLETLFVHICRHRAVLSYVPLVFSFGF